MKLNLAGKFSRVLILATGLALCAVSLLVVVASGDLAVRMLAGLGIAAGVIILLLQALVQRFSVFSELLSHVQYLSQSSEYTARQVRDISEVMQDIQRSETTQRSGGGTIDPKDIEQHSAVGRTKLAEKPIILSPEELELENAVKQFEV